MTDALIGSAVFAWAPYGSFVIGALYFATSAKSASLRRRIVSAAYAPLSAIIYFSIAFSSLGYQSRRFIPLYIAIQLLPLVFLFVSLRFFPGPRWVHAALLPVALVCMLWQGVWGYFAVFGK
jgi:hypothetical protein